jgi:hypothetical protein
LTWGSPTSELPALASLGTSVKTTHVLFCHGLPVQVLGVATTADLETPQYWPA